MKQHCTDKRKIYRGAGTGTGTGTDELIYVEVVKHCLIHKKI
jgi:hypothetical protein